MTSLTRVLTLLLASSGMAQAGGPTAVAPDPVPVASAPAAIHDWSGFYAGLGYGTASGSLDFTPGPYYDLTSGNTTTIFAGYLMQRGSFVYGGELALSQGSDLYIDVSPAYTDEEVGRVIDLKAKAGYAANRVLFYGVLGYSQVEWTIDNPAYDDFTTDGFAYGLGIDYAATNRLTVGLEYLSRSTSGASYNAGQDADLDLDTLSLRIGYQF
jgi:outer membrane immunogenic protein